MLKNINKSIFTIYITRINFLSVSELNLAPHYPFLGLQMKCMFQFFGVSPPNWMGHIPFILLSIRNGEYNRTEKGDEVKSLDRSSAERRLAQRYVLINKQNIDSSRN